MKSIIILSDTGEQNGILATILARKGYRLHTATFGRASLDLVRLRRPDLVILDTDQSWKAVMGFLSGMKADFCLWQTPAIIVSKASEGWEKAAALRRQNCLVLPKPVEASAVLEAVESLLAHTPRFFGRRQAS